MADVSARLAGLEAGELLVVDATNAVVLRARDPDAIAALVTAHNPEQWAHLDTAVLHQVLVEDLLHAEESTITYHHDAGQALGYVERHDAVAVLLAPVPVETVLQIAAEGVRMPRKSTSFGPKPRTGLLLRSFDLT